MKHPLAPEAFRQETGVSVSVLERLTIYLDVLARWAPKINLVGPGTLADPWRRHILDSAQLLRFLPENAPSILDMGSGAGFPGMVLAMLSDSPVTLVESHARKCAFLREVARQTATAVTILNSRLESLRNVQVQVVTARACAPLPKLLTWTTPLLAEGGVGLFLKGRDVGAELTQAQELWTMTATRYPSASAPDGVILKVEAVRPCHGS